jgi:hypothetical protein
MLQRLVLVTACAAALGSTPAQAIAQATVDVRDARTLVAIGAPMVAFSPIASWRPGDVGVAVRDTMLAMPFAAAPRSRSRGARRGLVIGAVGGALLGLVLTNDFLDEPAVNMAMGAAFLGDIGAGIGALVGADPPPAATPPGEGGSRR